MSTGTSKTRTQRLASIAAVHTRLQQTVMRLRKKSSIFCFLIFFTAFTVLLLVLQIWDPPFPYYEGMALNRDVVARVAFKTTDTAETEKEKVLAANRVPNVYVRNTSPELLKENIEQIVSIARKASAYQSLAEMPEELRQQFEVPEAFENSNANTAHDIWQFLRRTSKTRISPAPTPTPDSENALPTAPITPIPPVQTKVPVPQSNVPSRETSKNIDDSNDSGKQTSEKVPETPAVPESSEKSEPPQSSAVSVSVSTTSTESSSNENSEATVEEPETKEVSSDSQIPEEISDEHSVVPEKNEVSEKNNEILSISEQELSEFYEQLENIMRPFFMQGLMHVSEIRKDPLGRGLQVQITVVDSGILNSEGLRTALKSVILEDHEQIKNAIRSITEDSGVTDALYYCICRNWKSNLVLDPILTNQAIQNARQSVLPVQKEYLPSQRIVQMPIEENKLIGTLLTEDMVNLLSIEDEKWHSSRTLDEQIFCGISTGLLLLLCLFPIWVYIILMEPHILQELSRLIFLLSFTVFIIWFTAWCSQIPTLSRSFGLCPLVIFSQILTIQYHRQIGILFTGMALLCLCVALGMTSIEVLCDVGILLVTILPLDRLRGRLQFVQIAIVAGISAFLLFSAADLIMGVPPTQPIFNKALVSSLPLIFSGLVIQSFLPLLERWFGILSDVRLMELCDVSNPLLNELINRAPSTYSHSIALGTLGETAADAIGANGLLVRTAAYYHDVGKIYKPNYYAENLIVKENSPHNSLEPSMSALIIIAHVKNGVDLARQYKLPQQIIDLIEQHHGSGLVTYFYRQAQKRHLEDPTIPEPEEMSFRYPCPKPQTKEAVVLMMTDACESASRSLVEPTPARIQGLVRKISQERLEDEQFDESGITLTELRTIEASIVKGLISLHHGRIKYPDKIEKDKLKGK